MGQMPKNMTRFHERKASHLHSRNLEDLGLEDTPQYVPYEDETQNKWSFSPLAEELEPIPEVDDDV